MAAVTGSRLEVLCVSLTDMLNGAERVMLDVAAGIDRSRCRAAVVVPAEGAVSREARARSLDVFVVPAPRWLPFAHDPAPASYHWRRYWCDARTFVDPLAQIIRRRGIDVVYSASGTVLHGALAAAVCGRPHVHHLQELLGDPRLGLVMPGRRARRAYRMIAALATRVIGICEASERDASGAIGAAKWRTVRTGFHPIPPDGPVLPLPAAGQASVRVGIIGGVWEPKGAGLIAPIVQRVCRRLPGVHFYWLGPGRPERMEQIAREACVAGVPHLHFLGYRDEVAPLLRAVDFVLHPSRSECFSRVLVEAALARRPAVATRCGGTSEIVIDGVTGLLTAVDDVDAMAAAVARLASDRALVERLGCAAARHAAGFTMDAFVRDVEQVLFEAHRAGAALPLPVRLALRALLRAPAVIVPPARTLRRAGRRRSGGNAAHASTLARDCGRGARAGTPASELVAARRSERR